MAVETANDAAEAEFAEPIALEFDEGRFDHVEIIGFPEVGLDDPPFADERIGGRTGHAGTASNLGMRTRL